ncbi:hypothetical protein FOA52_006885 [Chlamydomonas sp. UWO 241]|nr:hypothetical protein FOA52_006885 [Chlamydomonas sp. UWO 241]
MGAQQGKHAQQEKHENVDASGSPQPTPGSNDHGVVESFALDDCRSEMSMSAASTTGLARDSMRSVVSNYRQMPSMPPVHERASASARTTDEVAAAAPAMEALGAASTSAAAVEDACDDLELTVEQTDAALEASADADAARLPSSAREMAAAQVAAPAPAPAPAPPVVEAAPLSEVAAAPAPAPAPTSPPVVEAAPLLEENAAAAAPAPASPAPPVEVAAVLSEEVAASPAPPAPPVEVAAPLSEGFAASPAAAAAPVEVAAPLPEEEAVPAAPAAVAAMPSEDKAVPAAPVEVAAPPRKEEAVPASPVEVVALISEEETAAAAAKALTTAAFANVLSGSVQRASDETARQASSEVTSSEGVVYAQLLLTPSKQQHKASARSKAAPIEIPSPEIHKAEGAKRKSPFEEASRSKGGSSFSMAASRSLRRLERSASKVAQAFTGCMGAAPAADAPGEREQA